MRFAYDRVPAEDTDSQAASEDATAIQMEPINTVEATTVGEASSPAIVVAEEITEVPATAAAPVVDNSPPKYEDDATPPPTYGHAVFGTSGADVVLIDQDDALVGGSPVGSFFTFLGTMFVSYTFGIVGYFACFLFAGSHAGRDGANVGFSFVIFQFSSYLQDAAIWFSEQAQHEDNDDSVVAVDPNQSDTTYMTDVDNESMATIYFVLSYILMLYAWFLLVRSLVHYIQVRRARSLLMAVAEAPVAVTASVVSPSS